MREFKKGELIYIEEEFAQHLFFITQGRVRIGRHGEDGKEITKVILSDGEVFGELALTSPDTKHRDFAEAMEPTTLCIIPSHMLRNLMKEFNPLSLWMMKIMGSRLLDMENRLESLVFKDSPTRIAECLYRLADKEGQKVGLERVLRKPITHLEIARLTATSRQTVTTVLNELRYRNIISFNRRRFIIRDMKALENAAKRFSLGQ
jgi:CRP-like cAMP-binding protein